MDSESVTINFAYRAGELWKVRQLALLHAPRRLVRLFVFPVFAGLVLSVITKTNGVGYVVTVVSAVIAFVLIYLLRSYLTIYKNKLAQIPREMTINADGITTSVNGASNQIAWVYVGELFVERSGYLMSAVNSEAFFWVPKRAFESTMDETRFTSIVRSNVDAVNQSA